MVWKTYLKQPVVFSSVFLSRKWKERAREQGGRSKVEQLNLLILFQQLISPKKTFPIPWFSRLPKRSSFQHLSWSRIAFPGLNLRRNSDFLRLSIPYLKWICRDQSLRYKLMSLHNHNAAGVKSRDRGWQNRSENIRVYYNSGHTEMKANCHHDSVQVV